MMDESCSNAYLESLRRRMGDFSMTGTELVMSPLPTPGPSFFFASAFSPTTGSRTVLGFLWRRSDFYYCFLLVDSLDEPVPIGVWSSTCFFKVACCLLAASDENHKAFKDPLHVLVGPITKARSKKHLMGWFKRFWLILTQDIPSLA